MKHYLITALVVLAVLFLINKVSFLAPVRSFVS